MSSIPTALPERKRIALIAHDNRKADLLEWARFNRDTLAQHELFGTGTTGGLIQRELDYRVRSRSTARAIERSRVGSLP